MIGPASHTVCTNKFDGGKPSYIVHAECPAPELFMQVCANVIKAEYFERAVGNGNFSIIVLGPE